jgi:hypothetical protein
MLRGYLVGETAGSVGTAPAPRFNHQADELLRTHMTPRAIDTGVLIEPASEFEKSRMEEVGHKKLSKTT